MGFSACRAWANVGPCLRRSASYIEILGRAQETRGQAKSFGLDKQVTGTVFFEITEVLLYIHSLILLGTW